MSGTSPARPDPGTAGEGQNERFKHLGRAVLETEAQAVSALLARIDDRFAQACRCLLACAGRIVVMGMGKSGHVGGKIAATLASTGSPAFFVHPGEASHGDLGMITPRDVVLALSNSGETAELVTLVPLIKRLGVPLVSLTGKPGSTLGRAATACIDVSVAREACPLGLAPTASTTATLAMGDALAVALLEARGFTARDFAYTHPGGALGRRLLLRVREVMHTGQQIPQVGAQVRLSEALMEISAKRLGMTAVVDDGQRLCGVFTDGDLRRALGRRVDVHATPIAAIMTPDPKTGTADLLAAEALARMQRHQITALLIVDEQRRVEGVVHLHDLLRAGVL